MKHADNIDFMDANVRQGSGRRPWGWLAALALAAATMLPPVFGAQYPPGKLTFQGHLTDAAGTPLGQTAPANVQVEFRLYRHATSSAASDVLWAEKQSVKVSGGFFNTLLGNGLPTGVAGETHTNNLAALFTGPDAAQRFLGVTVVGQGSEIRPRIQFFSSPFAFLARATANVVNDEGEPVFSKGEEAFGINVPTPTAALDVGGEVKAVSFQGDGSGLTGLVILAENITGFFTSEQIEAGTVTGEKFAAGSIPATKVQDEAVTEEKLAPDAATVLAGQAGAVGNSGVIVSSKKVDPVLHNMGYVNIGRATHEKEHWTIKLLETPTSPAPRMVRIGGSDARAASTLWTGTKWVVWGGMNLAQNGHMTGGAIYDVALNSWTTVSTVGAPAARDEIQWVWTGTKGIIWGGHNGNQMTHGAAFDPVANTWSPISTVNQPQARNRFRSVWTGTEMFVWGGTVFNTLSAVVNHGKLYNPQTDSWRDVPASPLVARRDFNAFWTGTEVLIWGGANGGTMYNDGAFFNPATGVWRPMTTVNAPVGREQGHAVLTDKEFIVWGGSPASASGYGGRYDLATDTWVKFESYGHEGVVEGTAFWNGLRAYFLQGRFTWGFNSEFGDSFSGYSFEPGSGEWVAIERAPTINPWPPHVWTGKELLIFGNYRDGNNRSVVSFKPQPESYFYRKEPVPAKRWAIRATSETPEAPPGRVGSFNNYPWKNLWTGEKWIVWGGEDHRREVGLDDGAVFDPAENSWKRMTKTNAPSRRTQFAAVWTGTEAIIWGGYGPTNFIADGKRYNLETDSWANVSSTGAPTARTRHSGVWTGSEMLIWGGATAIANNLTNNGARYNPALDSWSPIAQAPITNRCDAAAVWTGTEMIVWGGSVTINAQAGRADGAAYNPAGNSWRLISSVNAPSARTMAACVWTGTEMVVWGGMPRAGNVNMGGRYNPQTDTWTLFDTGEYIWDGTEAVVWTGSKVIFAANKKEIGGITYDPATGTIGTIPAAPITQGGNPFAWTGAELLTFGSSQDQLDQTVLSFKP